MKTSLNLIIARILTTAAKRRASDIHFSLGSPPILRIDNNLVELTEENLVTKEFLDELALSILTPRQKEILQKKREVVLTYVFEDKVRLKANIYYQKNSLAVSLKLIPLKIPSLKDLGLPEVLRKFLSGRGLIIIAGPYGSGKTTTAAALAEEINKTQRVNIITIEKPIEYVFSNNQSVIEQQEVGSDVNSFGEALKNCKDLDIDVLLVGENNEPETIPLIMELVTAGHLVFFIMNAISAIQAIEKFLAVFKPENQKNVAQFLAQSLKIVIVQRLIPRLGGGQVLATEILTVPLAVQSIIRDGKIHQLENVLQTSKQEGMISLDQSLADLVKHGLVSKEAAAKEALDQANFLAMV